MKTAGQTRNRCLRVRLGAAEEAAIYSRFPRRKVPGLVRAWLLLEVGAVNNHDPAKLDFRMVPAIVLFLANAQ